MEIGKRKSKVKLTALNQLSLDFTEAITIIKPKAKSKVITLKGEDAFIRLLAAQFGTTADMEINLIKVLIKFDLFSPFCMDKHIRRRIQKEMDVPYTTLGTAITRLIKSGIIARNGKNVYVNVAFRGLEEIDSIVFKKC